MGPGLERSGSPGSIECDPLPCGFAPAFLHGPSEAIAVRPGFDDVCSVGDSIEQRFAEPGVRNHLSPFRKGQVGVQTEVVAWEAFLGGCPILHYSLDEVGHGTVLAEANNGILSPWLQGQCITRWARFFNPVLTP